MAIVISSMVSGAKDAFEKSFMRSVAKNVDRRWRFPLLQVALLIRARRVASHWTGPQRQGQSLTHFLTDCAAMNVAQVNMKGVMRVSHVLIR